MSEDRSRRIKDLFVTAAELPAGERASFLDRECSGNPELRERVESLLAHDDPGPLVGADSDPFTSAATSADDVTELDRPATRVAAKVEIGRVLDGYKLASVLGSGGFGVVYLAEQSTPVKRRVAMKIIKPGMDSEAVIRRFEAERQALALMDHPSVAKIFDAGATPEGRPYFVMEYVQGEPITRYCDRQRLTIRKRLELFREVCDAIEHAHQKGIIHRDLKPSNILVGVMGDRPRPKVIDFGVAKAVSQRLIGESHYTEIGQLVGTPEYMSPEQAEMSPLDIDTRSDVYSLGVVLYELLTGALPFDSKTLRRAAFLEIQRVIREVDPPRPSTRLSGMGDNAQGVAERRRVQLSMLASQLRHELEWIPLKALRKDRTERYRSAAELSDDIGNYLAERPLIAGPESVIYKARKLLRRRKVESAAAATILLLLVVGVVGVSWQATVATRARTRAEIAQGRAEEETARAERRYGQIRKMTRIIDEFEAELAGMEGATAARSVLADTSLRVLRELSEEFGDDPALKLDLAQGYERVGRIAAGGGGATATAVQSYASAIRLFRELQGTEPTDDLRFSLVTAQVRYARVLGESGQNDPAIEQATEAQALLRGATTSRDRRATADALVVRGEVLLRQGNVTDAGLDLREAVRILRERRGAEPRSPETLGALANALDAQGYWQRRNTDRDAALTSMREAVALRETVVELRAHDARSKRDLLTGRERYGRLLKDARRFDEALHEFGACLTLAESLTEADPANTIYLGDLARAYENIGDLHYDQGNNEEAGRLFGAFETRAALLADADPLNLPKQRMASFASEKRGDVFARAGLAEEAVAAFEGAIRRLRWIADLDPTNRAVQEPMVRASYKLGNASVRADRSGAQRAWEQSAEAGAQLESSGSLDPVVAKYYGRSLRNLAWFALQREDGPRAVELFEGAMRLDPQRTARIMQGHARSHALVLDYDRASEAAVEAIELLKALPEPTQRDLARLLELEGELAEYERVASGEDL